MANISFFQLFKIKIKAINEFFVLWLACKIFATMLILLSLKRYRMSHNNGIAGKGWLKIVDNADIPKHDFFEPGKIYPLTVRHASATFLDDAMKVIRSISIKFSDHHFKSPFDMELNSGEFSVFWSVLSFIKFSFSRKEKYGVDWVKYNKVYPDGSLGAAKSVRRHATSFSNLHYHCKTPLLYIGKDGIKHYAKYRVIPYEEVPQSGTGEHGKNFDVSNQRVLSDENRGRNFLKDEYIELVKKGPVSYKLQIQLRVASDDEDKEVFNNMVIWNEKKYPWRELAYFEVTKTLDWAESTRTTFSINNMPKTLGILPAKSIYDYNSLNYLRAQTEIVKKVRLLSLKIFGMVPDIPDDDNRNIKVWSKKPL